MFYEFNHLGSPDYTKIEKQGTELIEADLFTTEDGTIKHDAMKLSSIIFSYLMR